MPLPITAVVVCRCVGWLLEILGLQLPGVPHNQEGSERAY